ncbi:MAG: uroporphyrinogen decarboxylase family protein [Bacteroidales bacterium]|nr:uroporphyrinogen decarboxylase family protein [Bacteroidales bacterium]
MEMTSKERCLAVMRNEIPDRIPVVPQSFMFSVETAGFRISDVNRNGKRMAQSHIISQKKYGYDGCVIDFDDASIAEACGAKVIFREDEPAIVDESDPVLKDLRDVYNLEVPDPLRAGRLPEWLAATSTLVEAIGEDVLVMGRADQGPFSVACLLRGTQQFMMDLVMEDKQVINDVIEFCRKACVAFAKAQKDAGAHVTSIGDALAGPNLVSPAMYREFALIPEKKLTREVQDYGIPYSIHICGNTNAIIGDLASTRAKILEVDWQVNMADARKKVPLSTVLMGNINPGDPMVFGTSEKVDETARKIIEDTKGKGLFLSTGCAMGRNTPHENFVAMINAAKKYGTCEQIMAMND